MKYIFYFLLSVSLACASSGWQDKSAAHTDADRFQVVYQRSIATARDVEGEPGFFNKAFNLIVGAHEKRLQRPFSIWVGPGGKILLSDQLQQTLVAIDTTGRRFTILSHLQSPSIAGLVGFPDGRILLSDSKLNALYWVDADANEEIPFAANTSLVRPAAMIFNPQTKDIWVAET